MGDARRPRHRRGGDGDGGRGLIRSRPGIVLGLADNHDSGAALVVEGRLVAAVGQERVDRRKNSGAFPWGAIEAVLELGGVRPEEVDRVVFGTAFTPSFLLRLRPGMHHARREEADPFSPALHAYFLYQSALRRAGLHGLEVAACRALLARRLRARGFRSPPVLADHHACHAHAAWRSQPRRRCLVFTADAMGDGRSATVWRGDEDGLEEVFAQSGRCALNTYYSRITAFLGFRPNRHEGKITGLAAYARPPPDLLAHFRRALRPEGEGFNRMGWLPPRRSDAFHRPLEGRRREEIAAALQVALEEAVTAWIAHHVRRQGIPDIAVAGGIFANVKLNQRIAELPEVRSLWVYPNMGDGGLAAGAAMLAGGVGPAATRDVYLGHEVTEAAAREAIATARLRPERPEDPAEAVAELLARGKVVARCAGRMEWGPRALGNRSILVRPDDPSVNDWLNERLRRTEFMPFAPVVLQEEAPALFRGLEKAAEAARFMTVCFDCTPAFRRQAPGVVHVDGTARPQVLGDENPGMRAILEAFRRRTGLPALVNTSFNLHEEPIVATPGDAIRAWRLGRLDALLLGPFLLRRPAA